MAEYVNITKEEMEEVLSPQGFKQVSLPSTIELVYGKRVDVDGLMLTLRIYSSINPDGNARDVGEDAIRCMVMWRKEDGDVKKIGTTKRVNRVGGWRKNLQSRIDKLEDLVGPICTTCKSPMVERKGTNNSFWGCSNWPNCKHTQNI